MSALVERLLRAPAGLTGALFAAFANLFDETVTRAADPAGVVYQFSGDEARAAAVAAVSEIEESLAPYVADAGKQAGYNAAIGTASTGRRRVAARIASRPE